MQIKPPEPRDKLHTRFNSDLHTGRNILRYISDQYQEFARWEDKFFDDKVTPDGMPMLNEAAILNPEQESIARELQGLRDCYIGTLGSVQS